MILFDQLSEDAAIQQTVCHGRIMDLEKETGLDEKRKKEEAERYEYERRNNPNRRNAAGQQPREPLLPAGNSIHETDDETDYSDLVHPGRLTQLEAGGI